MPRPQARAARLRRRPSDGGKAACRRRAAPWPRSAPGAPASMRRSSRAARKRSMCRRMARVSSLLLPEMASRRSTTHRRQCPGRRFKRDLRRHVRHHCNRRCGPVFHHGQSRHLGFRSHRCPLMAGVIRKDGGCKRRSIHEINASCHIRQPVHAAGRTRPANSATQGDCTALRTGIALPHYECANPSAIAAGVAGGQCAPHEHNRA